MYNQEFKEKFLASLDSEHKVSLFTSLFAKSSSYEEEFERDLYDFTMKDLDLFYYGIATPSENTLAVFHSIIIQYIDYAIKDGQRMSNINIFRNIAGTSLGRYVASYKNQYLTLSEFNDFMKYVANDIDVAIYRSLFEGISGEQYSEIRNLKMSDIEETDGRILANLLEEKKSGETLERTIEITPQLFKDLQYANRQKEYVANNGTSVVHAAAEVVDSPYVFRPVKRGAYLNSNGQINMQTVFRKKILLNELTDGQIRNINTLVVSGMLHMANEIFRETGQLTDDDFFAIGEHYKKNIKSKYESRVLKHIKDLLRLGLEQLYGIVI